MCVRCAHFREVNTVLVRMRADQASAIWLLQELPVQRKRMFGAVDVDMLEGRHETSRAKGECGGLCRYRCGECREGLGCVDEYEAKSMQRQRSRHAGECVVLVMSYSWLRASYSIVYPLQATASDYCDPLAAIRMIWLLAAMDLLTADELSKQFVLLLHCIHLLTTIFARSLSLSLSLSSLPPTAHQARMLAAFTGSLLLAKPACQPPYKTRVEWGCAVCKWRMARAAANRCICGVGMYNITERVGEGGHFCPHRSLAEPPHNVVDVVMCRQLWR